MDYSIMNGAILWITRIISALFSWFSDLAGALHVENFYISVLTIYTVYRFILSPLIGSSGSDTTKSVRKSGVKNSNK